MDGRTHWFQLPAGAINQIRKIYHDLKRDGTLPTDTSLDLKQYIMGMIYTKDTLHDLCARVYKITSDNVTDCHICVL